MTSTGTTGTPVAWRPWAHAAVAAVIGALLVRPVQSVVVVGIFGGAMALLYLAVLIVFSALAFGAVGRFFLGRRGWHLAWTTVLYLPVAVAATFFITNEGSLSFGDPRSLVLCAAVPAVLALFAYRGIARIVAAVIAVIAVVVATSVGATKKAEADYEAGYARFGSDMRPYVTDLDGYTQLFEPRIAGPDVIIATFLPEGVDATGEVREPGELAIITQRNAGLCDPIVYGISRSDGPVDQVTCDETGDTAVRTTATNHEVSKRVGDIVVRANAAMDVPLDELTAALDASRLIDDRYYRHLLFGEQGEYIEELDGKR